MPEMKGILNLYKPCGPTSHDMVYRVRRIFGTKAVGHAGTLDPLAEGVLVMLVGRATKLSEIAADHEKAYTAVMRLGVTTDTQDITGAVLSRSDLLPGAAEVASAAAGFVGRIGQIPPMYSAVKVGGVKLYELARAGAEIERKKREIEVYSIETEPTGDPSEYILRIRCSKGTYIRTMCDDIGRTLGCGAVMAALKRTSCGGLDISSAHTPDELAALGLDELAAHLIPAEEYLSSRYRAGVELPQFYHRLAVNGAEIYLHKLPVRYNLKEGDRALMFGSDGDCFALGVVAEYPGGLCIKAEYFI